MSRQLALVYFQSPNTILQSDVGQMLAQRRPRWANIHQTSGRSLILSGAVAIHRSRSLLSIYSPLGPLDVFTPIVGSGPQRKHHTVICCDDITPQVRNCPVMNQMLIRCGCRAGYNFKLVVTKTLWGKQFLTISPFQTVTPKINHNMVSLWSHADDPMLMSRWSRVADSGFSGFSVQINPKPWQRVFLYKPWRPKFFFRFEIIINVLVSFRFIWL